MVPFAMKKKPLARCIVGFTIEEVCLNFPSEKFKDHTRTFVDVLKIENKT